MKLCSKTGCLETDHREGKTGRDTCDGNAGCRPDLRDAKVKRDIASQVMPLIDDVADSVEREAYRQQLATFERR